MQIVLYDAFGRRTELMNSGIAFDRSFTGQVLDAETGLMLYRNRYYCTNTARFVTRDPIGYDAEDVNLYRYAGNMPVQQVDPSGLQGYGWDEFSYYVGGPGIPYTPAPDPPKAKCRKCDPLLHDFCLADAATGLKLCLDRGEVACGVLGFVRGKIIKSLDRICMAAYTAACNNDYRARLKKCDVHTCR